MHQYSPVCIAVAAVYLSLRAFCLTQHPATTFWLVQCQRALQIDFRSVRQCALLIDRLAVCLGRPKSWDDNEETDPEAALSAALSILLGPAAATRSSALLAHSPVSAGLTRIRTLHPATFRSAVLAEAAMAGAEPEHAQQLVSTARGIKNCARVISESFSYCDLSSPCLTTASCQAEVSAESEAEEGAAWPSRVMRQHSRRLPTKSSMGSSALVSASSMLDRTLLQHVGDDLESGIATEHIDSPA